MTKLSPSETFIQVRFNDVDLAGHVNNAVYQEYFDLGKLYYFHGILGSEVDWKKEGLVLANINIDYFLPILLDEKLLLKTSVESFGTKSFIMMQELYNEQGTELKSKAKSVMVCFDFQANTTIPVPSGWIKRITTYENH